MKQIEDLVSNTLNEWAQESHGSWTYIKAPIGYDGLYQFIVFADKEQQFIDELNEYCGVEGTPEYIYCYYTSRSFSVNDVNFNFITLYLNEKDAAGIKLRLQHFAA